MENVLIASAVHKWKIQYFDNIFTFISNQNLELDLELTTRKEEDDVTAFHNVSIPQVQYIEDSI